MGKICCVTGNRPQKFPWKYGCGEEMDKYLSGMKEIVKRLIAEGYDYFISGGALGVDQDFAEVVLSLKKKYTHIALEIAVPCRTQAERFSEVEKKRYNEILSKADIVNVLWENRTSFCMQKRNEYMVKKSDLTLAFWNGKKEGGTYHTIMYAQRKGKRVEAVLLM